jgi:hypothetical protein
MGAEGPPGPTGRLEATTPSPGGVFVSEPEEIARARAFVAGARDGLVPNPAKAGAIAESLGLRVSESARPAETIRRIEEALARHDAHNPADVAAGEKAAAPAGVPTFADIPTSFHKRAIVKMPGIDSKGRVKMTEMSADAALADLDQQEEAYRALRACIG